MTALAALLLLTAALADPGLTLEESRRLLRSGSVDERREAVVQLGTNGDMSVVPALVEALRDEDPGVRGLAEVALWQVWSRSGDAEVDRLLLEGIALTEARRLPEAVEKFNEVIARAPDFAEGWNRRATAYYLMREFEKSLADCEEVVRRNPHHFGALSGFGLNYIQLGQLEKALHYFERALAVNPNLTGVEQVVKELREILRQRRRETI
ncbi:MAG: tetratricopeptide repeat protein [Candidatus Rokubacteria bacterium]|nr:tetratricopeptide repeat protein [Candidatus Rokubacteria bacterium]